ncbi:MAG: tRNA pseudouridine(55) synthase TruB [Brevundimonas diminuta]|nr:MAG: tRNA pseudouridine(55) synthase TruB [Brevundimonas diminuta]
MARRKKGDLVNGWVCLDKPYEMGSTEAVTKIRRLFNAQKAGHAGTLDPLASGILPIALGEATKTVPFMMEAQKVYRFTIHWGISTDSIDREGEIIARSDVRPSVEAVTAALPSFVGEIVRSLARDLAIMLGAEGHVSDLRRERVGPFSVDNAVTLDFLEELAHKGAAFEGLLPVSTALDDIPELAVTGQDALSLRQGRPIVLLPRQIETLKDRLPAGSRLVSVFEGGTLVALGNLRAGRLEPDRVFNLP